MFGFLVSQFDPNHRPNPNVQEYVLQQMKRVSYPFTISKSALQSVGSPHTWPHLLAVLSWMVELLQYENEVTKDEFEEDDDKFFFEYLGRTYNEFLEAPDSVEAQEEQEAGWDRELDEQFELRDASIQNDSESLDAANADLQAQIETLENEVAELAGTEQRREDMRNEVPKYEELVEKLTQHKENMELQIEQKRQEVADKEAELAVFQSEKVQLGQLVGSQEMSVGDVQRLQQDRASIDDELRRVAAQRQTTKVELENTSEATKAAITDVEAHAAQHQKLAEELKLVPTTAKRAEGFDFSITFDRHAANEKLMVNKDLKHVIKPKLGEVKSKLKAKFLATEEDRFAAQAKLETLNAKTSDATDAIKQHEEAQERVDRESDAEKDIWVQKNRVMGQQVDEVEARLHQLKTADESSLADSQRKLEDLHRDYTETAQRCQTEKATMNDALLTLTFELTDHRECAPSRHL